MTGFQGVKLLVSDVDGTLLTRDKALTQRARDAVHRLRQTGVRFAITSGRPPRGMAMLIEPLALDEPIAGFNGGAYVDSRMNVLAEHLLAQDAANLALSRMLELGLDVWVYASGDWYLRDPAAAHVDREARTVEFGPKVQADLSPLLDWTAKLVGVSDDYDLVRKAESDLQARLGSRASASRSQPYYLDVTHPLANKGAVIDYHAARLGISRDSICSIGDGPNDTLMFSRTGHSIAMGNAPSDVQAAAQAVTDSCDDEGFAKAVEKFLL